MNADPESLPSDETETMPAGDPVKPACRSRTPKAAAGAPIAAETAELEPIQQGVELSEPMPKPKRSRRTAAESQLIQMDVTNKPQESTASAQEQDKHRRKDALDGAPREELPELSAENQAKHRRNDALDGAPREKNSAENASAVAVAGTDQRAAPVAQFTVSPSEAGTEDVANAPLLNADDQMRPRGRRHDRRNRQRSEFNDGGGPNEGAPQSDPAVPVQAGELFAHVLSGEFDTSGESPPEPVEEDSAEDNKRVLLPEPDAPKLHKVLAQSGVGSRRDMEDLITEGHVTVNGQVAHVGQRVSFGDLVKIKGKPVRVRIVPPPPRIIAYHKPVGEIVTHDDPENRPTVFRRLPRLQQGKWQSVGRLDINTEGLLLFTNSGELANQLMHPRFGIEREYAVRLLGTLTSENKASLLAGVEVDGQQASFRSIAEGGGEGVNHWYRVVITEGRNREVRKLFDTVGLTVSRLIRIRYGTVVLPLGLKRGVWVDLEEDDVHAIGRLAGLRDNSQRGGQRGDGRGGRQDGRTQGPC
jgi:23S rRNA pseudouridine2605 synthase